MKYGVTKNYNPVTNCILTLNDTGYFILKECTMDKF